jgi:tetratricopeptide (TPR) repeat protein
MLGLLLIIALGTWVIFHRQTVEEVADDIPTRLSDKLDQLWSIAQDSLKTKRYLRAEKALLTILRIDERNTSAYNRLGILYAKQKSLKDAIECFEIAQSLEPNASSLHNVGLIYYETQNYEKAALAFEQAIAIDENMSSRYIAYAKVQEKLGHDKKMIEALEKSVELDPIPQTLKILADAYERTGESEIAFNIRERAGKTIIPPGQPKQVHQPRKVM